MLASPPLSFLHSRFHHFSSPLRSSSPDDNKSKRRRKSSIHERIHEPSSFKTPSFVSKPPPIPTKIHSFPTPRCSARCPDTKAPIFASVQSSMDPESLSRLLESCTSVKQVKSVHAFVLRILDASFPFVGNNLISAYVRFSEWLDARKLFDGMPVRNVVTWTAMLSGYLKMGLDDDAFELFREFSVSCIRGNSLTFVCVLKLCGNASDFELGRQIHACVVKGGWRNLIVDSSLVYFYARCGDLSTASGLFSRMPIRDVVSWTTMISAYSQQGRADEALAMFSQMHCDGFHPNEFTVCSVLKACGEKRALRFGRQLHGAIVKGLFNEDVYVGSCLVNMYVKCGEVADARVVFNLMPKRNTITWTSMIAGYAQHGLGEEAISLFLKMKRRRILANDLTIVSILGACGSVGSLSLGKEVHSKILRNFCQNNIHIASTLIWFYCKCGEYSYAIRVLENMPQRDVISWTSIISGSSSLGHGSEALQLLNDMLWEGVYPNAFTYSSALKVCAKLEDVRHGKWIHASANKTQALSNVFVGSALIDMYMKCGCITDASRVFNTMPDRNLVSWKAMITGYAKNGRCREALQLMYRMQAEGFDVEDYVLSTVLTSCGDFQWEVEPSSSCCVQST